MFDRLQVQKALCFVGLLLYLAVLPLYFYLIYQWYLRGELDVFLALLVVLVAPMLVVNLVSAILVMKNEDFSGRIIAQNICIASHCFQMGVAWRLVILVKSFNRRKMLEFSLLVVGQATSSFLPAVLLEGYLLHPILHDIPRPTEAFVSVCIISSALSFSLAQLAFRCEQEALGEISGVKFVLLNLCHLTGVLCLLISRCLSFVLFIYSLTYWIFLLVGLHFLLCLASSLLYTHLQLRKVNYICILRQTGLMSIHLYDSVSTRPGPGKCVNVLYYTLILVENILMTAVWVMTSGHADVAKLVVAMLMLGTFVLGVILKFVCYNYDETENSADDSDRKTLDVMAASRSSVAQRTPRSTEGHCHHDRLRAIGDNQADSDIVSNKATVSAKITNPWRSGPTVTSASYNSENSSGTHSKRNHSPQSYSNHAFDVEEIVSNDSHPRDKTDTINVEKWRKSAGKGRANKPSSDTTNIGGSPQRKSQNSRARLKSHRGYCSEEQTDIGSSNSRNTNTLDVSGQSSRVENQMSCEQNLYNNVPKTNREPTHTWQQTQPAHISGPKRQIPPAISNPCHERQLRPQSCAPFLGGLRGEDPVVCYRSPGVSGWWPTPGGGRLPGWRNPPYLDDQYSCDFTDTTSYYDSLSYYYTATSTHSSSDSDCARTWPPSLPPGCQNHGAQLPDEKLSPEERISIWFQRSKQYFSQDLITLSAAGQSQQPPPSLRFEANRRTFAGYKNKLSFSSTSSKRLPPRGIKPTSQHKYPFRAAHLGNCDHYRIQFQTYMDSLKKRRLAEGVRSRCAVPGGVINTGPGTGGVPGRRAEFLQGIRQDSNITGKNHMPSPTVHHISTKQTYSPSPLRQTYSPNPNPPFTNNPTPQSRYSPSAVDANCPSPKETYRQTHQEACSSPSKDTYNPSPKPPRPPRPPKPIVSTPSRTVTPICPRDPHFLRQTSAPTAALESIV
ncbi:uncharacterized protein LOC135471585 [Liolophura sinensis]|uniref:uncharacterized protein LOC135471585 n=1 Tax=Liolophura sinensis TaxID=3198878 RepID=UPI0031584551